MIEDSVVYKIEFEYVNPISGYVHSDLKDSEIPETEWFKTDRVTQDPWAQYNTLVRWEKEGTHRVRNIKIYRGVWKSVKWELYRPERLAD